MALNGWQLPVRVSHAASEGCCFGQTASQAVNEREDWGTTMKYVSGIALAAAAGIFAGALAFAPAKAADLGGDCCADLEERVAELEATTVRKGNRVVTLTLSGQVNKTILVWDDGVDSDVFIGDHDEFQSGFSLSGSATMKPGWTAGFLIETEVQGEGDTLSVTQNNSDGGNNNVNLRQSNVYIESEQLGRVTMGFASLATDNIGFNYIGGHIWQPFPFSDFSFRVRGNQGVGVDEAVAGGLVFGSFFNNGAIGDPANRQNVVRYDSPTFAGFMVSASWGESDVADVALKWAKQWNSLKVTGALGYYWDSDDDFPSQDLQNFGGNIGIKHEPSGLWATGHFSLRDYDEDQVLNNDGTEDDSHIYGVMAGISKNWNGYGDTIFHLSYGYGEDGQIGNTFSEGIYGTEDATNDNFVVTSSEVDRYGVGLAQNFDAAALQVHTGFHYYEFDATGVETDGNGEALAGGTVEQNANMEDFWSWSTGMIIYF